MLDLLELGGPDDAPRVGSLIAIFLQLWRKSRGAA
jgi:hypothetical protein